ncbi:hypothetical protein DNU06_04745 [Putridiphycobacter roseus]|uniref:STAS domain-containing protein n=1 Tax=Putridiphycobacter roseus TaxID=2219161 RepID=A0A2W1N301_9FLAO|nr:STAS domain-containing protein [Putridiphycobacter roseus]PZE17930.1 hypothetical protein DNU06_04745 [Putridiphycobacter roseus]
MNQKVSFLPHGQVIEIKLEGKGIDEEMFAIISKQIKEYENSLIIKFIINLESMPLLTSTDLNYLIKSFTLIRNLGGELYIVNISDKINHVLLLTKLNTVLNIATSLKNALEHLK